MEIIFKGRNTGVYRMLLNQTVPPPFFSVSIYADYRRAPRHRRERVLDSYPRFAHVLLRRAQMARLEKQLHDGAKASQTQRPRAWANVSQPTPAEAPPVSRAAVECNLPMVTHETEHKVGRGGAPCNSEAGRAPYQGDCASNRSAANGHNGTMRLALEQQQRGATMAMASDAYSVSCGT